MNDFIYINDVEFIDETGGVNGNFVYSLVSEESASTIGVYDSEDTVSDAIQRRIKDLGESTKDFWGVVYVLNRDLEG